MSVLDSTAGGPLKGVSGSPSVQDSAPKKGYLPLCFATDVGPDLACRANVQKHWKLKLPSTVRRESSVKGRENWMLFNSHP